MRIRDLIRTLETYATSHGDDVSVWGMNVHESAGPISAVEYEAGDFQRDDEGERYGTPEHVFLVVSV